MNFEEVLFRAQMGDQEAILQILEMFRPLLIKNSLINGRFDEDLYQELRIEVLKCIRTYHELV
ncbi:helix-turn-helix domain-containing protein [Oliverpabstia intestinalis]|uniref:helix-turn-helix domain-containing protein n=1 Tax=Lachnospiraceae TaxID=186803 RepID=UPI001F30ED37|nr:helix-turn-helix domain-containing protein [Faecalicatena contorta]MCI6432261.1 helix-turn-helix domain-containing protein [Lachnospiraceae bacterium]MDD7142780.1 helix-turn-helix domain-containing protein [bacterium]MDY2884236.1 helix-turn-helix domain-containing protein [Bariatricus sp.]MCF2683778.1 helix-turn-helix domain-containing protein [Faecalicatena contorta]MDY4193226.1 helix-turn-helix domain-containing protein [Bariatricus sp.]